MGLLAQALIVFALSFGLCAWLLGYFMLSRSEMGTLREQLLSSDEKAAIEEQEEAIAQAAAAPVSLVPPPVKKAEADAVKPADEKKSAKKVGKSRGGGKKDNGTEEPKAEEDTLPIRLTPMTATCRVPPLSRVKLGIGWSRGVARDAEQ